MANKYNLDGIKTSVAKEIVTCRSRLEAWEKVTFPTKKDGKPFASMSKNIDGAKYEPISHAMQPGEYELTIHLWTEHSGYINDTLSCYNLVKHLTNEKQIAKTENYMPKSYLEQVYKYDLDDIKEAVANRIEHLKKRIASLEKQFDIVDKCYNDFKEAFGSALADLEKNCMEAGSTGFTENRNDIYYMILDTVKERFPYC